MSYSIKGKIHQISPDKQVTEKYKTREFVLFVENEKNPEYSDYITLQFSQAYCDLLDKFEIGHDVEVKFDVKGKKYEKQGEVRYFNTLAAWKIEFVGAGTAAQQQSQKSVQQPPLPPQQVDNDDLPF
jgi:hypothetical protein